MLSLHTYAPDPFGMFDLLTRYAKAFLQTDETMDLYWVLQLCQEEPIWHFTYHSQLAGVIWWQGLEQNNTATLHLVLKPQVVRQFWRQRLDVTLLQLAQKRWQLADITATFDPARSQPGKWLLKAGFEFTGLNGDNQAQWQYQFSKPFNDKP
jgi:hypothetical protein